MTGVCSGLFRRLFASETVAFGLKAVFRLNSDDEVTALLKTLALQPNRYQLVVVLHAGIAAGRRVSVPRVSHRRLRNDLRRTAPVLA